MIISASLTALVHCVAGPWLEDVIDTSKFCRECLITKVGYGIAKNIIMFQGNSRKKIVDLKSIFTLFITPAPFFSTKTRKNKSAIKQRTESRQNAK